jgi:glycolate oxidase iron-sulfur subunit
MQTALADFIRDTPEGKEANAILRACVHCGFCTATCPTYLLLGDEQDSPRGRIYLIKEMLEGRAVTAKTQTHLDRCLTCRSCETTCPSGVRFGRLVDIGRQVAERQVGRPLAERVKRQAIVEGMLARPLFGGALGVARALRPFLPRVLGAQVPERRPAGAWPPARHARRMLALDGCVQETLAPSIDAAMARVLERIGVSLVRVAGAGCCGALPYHLNAGERALALVKRNIDAWWPHVQSGAEAIVVTATGCGVMVKDYGHLLRHDAAYADKAARIASLARDPVEVVGAEWSRIEPQLAQERRPQKVAFQSPCTLQHGMKLAGRVEAILPALGLEVVPVRDPHLCCGSAGTYSVLQAELANALRARKLAALTAARPDVVVSANVGCTLHLAAASTVPVKHWIEILSPEET